MGKSEFDKYLLGRAPPGSKIVWRGDPSGSKEILVQDRPKSKYAKKPYDRR